VPVLNTATLGPVLNTATLGPVRFDPDRDAERARLVREAMRACDSSLLAIASNYCSDATLAKLGRMLKHG